MGMEAADNWAVMDITIYHTRRLTVSVQGGQHSAREALDSS